MEKFWGESTESHVILCGVWLLVYFCRRIARSSLRYHSFLVLNLPYFEYIVCGVAEVCR